MKSNSVERGRQSGPGLEKVAEVGHRESLVQPNVFVLQRRLKEIELRTQRIEETLSQIYLSIEDQSQHAPMKLTAA